MKRIYKDATVSAVTGGYGILLDERPLNTPGGRLLVLPSRALAEAVREEWQVQGKEVVPASMPMMRYAAIMHDRIAPDRAARIADLVGYAASDLLCYRAEEPADLVARQAEKWQPLLDWARAEHGAGLVVATGLMPVQQPAEALEGMRKAIAALDDVALTGLALATPLTGSLVLGLALVSGRISVEEAFELSQLDETYQIERWGEDYEAADRRVGLMEELVIAHRFLELARSA